MEQYIRKLSECQQAENTLREERDALLRRHERELEELDARMTEISAQRTRIIDEFKQFLDSVELFQQSLGQNGAVQQPTAPPKLLRAESTEAALEMPEKPFQSSLLTVDTSDAVKSTSQCSTPSPTYHSASHSPNPVSISDVAPVEAVPVKPENTKPAEEPKPKSKSGRSFKFVHRLATSKSAGSVPSAITVASPTTTQIESMLSKVKENSHSLDANSTNALIDLLSSRIMKDKETNLLLTLPTPEPMADPKEEIKPLSFAKDQIKEEKETEVVKQKPAPIGQLSQPDSVPTSASESQSPNQPSSPKKRIETPEERRRRIERVLFESPTRSGPASTLSRSATSLNDMDLGSPKRSSMRPSPSSSRYGNRNKTKVRRNHSLSPLRFCQRKQMSEDRELLDSEEFGEIRRAKSDQQLDSDSVSAFSADDSANEADALEADSSDIGSTTAPRVSIEDEDDHLLAPSKVAKSQDLFHQVFFPQDKREKPLMSKEELAKTRTNAFKKKQTQSLSQDSSRGSESPDSTGGSLRVDYLSHLRRSSASPEQRSRERELNSLNNTKKFRCFQDFWEKKTNEVLDKQRNYEQWHQTNSVVGVAPQQPQQTRPSQKPTSPVNKSKQSKSPKPKPEKPEKPKISVTKQGIEKFEPQPKVMVPTQPTRVVSNVRPVLQKQQPVVIKEKPIAEKSSFIVPARIIKQASQDSVVIPPAVEKKPLRDDIENDQLLQRLRHIQQDIRQRKIKQLNGGQQQQQQQQPIQNQTPAQPQPNPQKPTIQAAKSLDLQYYPLKQQGFVPKSAAVRIVQPNGSEPPPTKNRIRLIRSSARDEPDDPPVPAVVIRHPEKWPSNGATATNGNHRHTVEIGSDLSNSFRPLQPKPSPLVESTGPMRSTYF